MLIDIDSKISSLGYRQILTRNGVEFIYNPPRSSLDRFKADESSSSTKLLEAGSQTSIVLHSSYLTSHATRFHLTYSTKTYRTMQSLFIPQESSMKSQCWHQNLGMEVGDDSYNLSSFIITATSRSFVSRRITQNLWY